MNTKEYVLIGKIVSSFGLRGEVKLLTNGDVLEQMKAPLNLFLVLPNKKEEYSIHKLVRFRKQGNIFIILLDGISTIDEVQGLLGSDVYVSNLDIPEIGDPNEFFIFQLIGLNLKSDDSRSLQFSLVEVMDNPVHPVLRFLDKKQKEILVPFIKEYIGEVNLKDKYIEVFNWQDFLA